MMWKVSTTDLRESVFNATLQRSPEVFYWLDEEKLKWLFNSDIFGCANCISKAWERWQDCLINIYIN